MKCICELGCLCKKKNRDEGAFSKNIFRDGHPRMCNDAWLAYQ